MALVGRNGAGKSTTLKAILGLVAARRRTAGLPRPIPSRPFHLPHRPARPRLRTGGPPHLHRPDRGREPGGGPAGRARRPVALDARSACSVSFPNLAEMRGRRGNQMSGGEQQMLSIARTLMGNPEAILLDEPSEGLAPVIVQMMAEAIRAMKAEGVAVLLSEQNWAFAAGRQRPGLRHRTGRDPVRRPGRGPHGRRGPQGGHARGLTLAGSRKRQQR